MAVRGPRFLRLRRAALRRGAAHPRHGARVRRRRGPADHRAARPRRARSPPSWCPKMAELGLLGASIKGYGCAGLGAVAYGLICRSSSAATPGSAASSRCRARSCMYPIYAYGSRGAEERWLPAHGRGRGDRLLRPDRARLRLQPRRHAHHAPSKNGGGWVLNGTKMWITNGSIADVARGLGARPTTASAASWSRRGRRASPPPTSTASGRCAPR